MIFKQPIQPIKQMYDEGPVLLSVIPVKGQHILHQLRNDLKACVASKGFRLDKY